MTLRGGSGEPPRDCGEIARRVSRHGGYAASHDFFGPDIVAVSRTAWDGSHNFHDANYLTLHRVPNFRDRKAGAPPLEYGRNGSVTCAWPPRVCHGRLVRPCPYGKHGRASRPWHTRHEKAHVTDPLRTGGEKP
jgi:hypothetical protein